MFGKEMKQHRQGTFWHIHVPTVATEKQQCVPSVLLTYTLLQKCNKYCKWSWKHNNAFFLLLGYICSCQQLETHFGLQALHPTFLSDCDEMWSSLTDFHEVPNTTDVQWQPR
jgi:hypothetical protein